MIYFVRLPHRSLRKRCDSVANALQSNSGVKEEKITSQGGKKNDTAFFFYQQRAIIYLGMKHKPPCTLVAMATIKSIAEFFLYLSPHSFFAECKVTRSTVCCKAGRQYVWSPARHKMSGHHFKHRRHPVLS